jgi:hypothetical protein
MQTRTRFAALLTVGTLATLPAASQAALVATPGDVPQTTMAPQGGTLDRLNGHAWNTGPGGATRIECQSYADAFNELAAQSEDALLAGDQTKSDEKGRLATGVLQAGQARGCTFLADPV